MTFALVARCAQSGMVGTAVASSSPAVAARCAFAEAGVGAVSSQNLTDPTLGSETLALMRGGAGAQDALHTLRQRGRHMAYRQVLAVDSRGETAVFSGEHTLGVWAQQQTPNAAAAGNLLAHKEVIAAMLQGFAQCEGHLGECLLCALETALAAGGEAGPIHSAGMKIAHEMPWPYVDLRCDWSEECPVATLRQAWAVYQPQMDDYVRRALQPQEAPAFGVPGDA